MIPENLKVAAKAFVDGEKATLLLSDYLSALAYHNQAMFLGTVVLVCFLIWLILGAKKSLAYNHERYGLNNLHTVFNVLYLMLLVLFLVMSIPLLKEYMVWIDIINGPRYYLSLNLG